MNTVETQIKNTYAALKDRFGYVNERQAPRMVKVVVSSGVGSIVDKEKLTLVPDRLAKITGQKPSPRSAKKSIASFKVRQGTVVGYSITLRGARMLGFLEKFLQVALPRTRDFKGISSKIVDDMGNATIGIKEHTIFPETSDEELKNVFGLSVTLVSTAKNKEEAIAFFDHIGVPFRKE
ncbi:MAG: 50S ribosomal protein L5 [Candidatus Yonathbacteria bacterium]|nr:50S ribosomal protein L5 [Candidatus Yonathbacteria bacterium]